MKSYLFVPAIAVMLALGLSACKSSHEEGVKSTLRSQWTTVNANTEVTTNAAKAVLEAEGLKEVSASSTMVDGRASGKMADGTKVDVTISKKDAISEVTVVVGSLGSPELGAEIARKIKDKAEGK